MKKAKIIHDKMSESVESMSSRKRDEMKAKGFLRKNNKRKVEKDKRQEDISHNCTGRNKKKRWQTRKNKRYEKKS